METIFHLFIYYLLIYLYLEKKALHFMWIIGFKD